MYTRECETIRIDIYMAGDFAKAIETCREFCDPGGLCVHVEQCVFTYRGGTESGFKVGLINYPRFPETHDQLWTKAESLAKKLLGKFDQQVSFSIVGPQKSVWYTWRESEDGPFQPTCQDAY